MRMLSRPFNALAALFGLGYSEPIETVLDEYDRRISTAAVRVRKQRSEDSHGKDTANGAAAMARRVRQQAYARDLHADIANNTLSDAQLLARHPEALI